MLHSGAAEGLFAEFVDELGVFGFPAVLFVSNGIDVLDYQDVTF